MANIFPRWTNVLPFKIAICVLSLGAGVVAAFSYYATPKTLVVGYQPSQPIPFSHRIHVEQVGLDCRYCHSFVDVSGHSNVPTSNTCWNCHRHVQTQSPKLQPLRNRMDPLLKHPDFGKPVEWVRIHKTPDYVYFNHSAHVNRGISCQSCHGRVDQMEVVYQDQNLSMGWCLECHRHPEKNLRPLEEVYNLSYDAEKYLAANPIEGVKTTEDLGLKLKEQWQIHPPTSCATCHH
ncbi:hypothetical protein HNR46_004061 [Haloferula luteola]|uniref:Cytochrome c7-like domain-containing protein n=1 Tax=Haloferula luteola TaxID=595692 RepID=A0A840VGS9_9BACT|nr:cytochrome c3 family protein [Haloferula luteola]MBB5353798.1 hypothetical protein [Haloferula luteola]